MIKFTSLTMRNFLSYGNNTTVVQIDRPGATLVVGENLDDTANGKGANGVGKSAIINALTYAVFDKPVSNISKDNLVNNINKKNMEVSVEFIASNGKKYQIIRTRKSKAGAAGNTVHLMEEGKDITPDSVNATNDLILKIVGIPYELFVRIVVFTASHTPFLDLPTTSQVAIIEELFGLTDLSNKAVALKEIMKDTKFQIETAKVRVESLKREQERHTQQLDSAKRRVVQWEVQNRQAIDALHEKLKKVEEVDVEQQKSLHLLLVEIDKQLNAALETQRKLDRDKKDKLTKLTKNEADLEHLRDAKCPFCKQKFADAAAKITELETVSDTLGTELEALQKQLKDVTKQIKEFTTRHKEVKAQITVDDVEALIDLKNQSANIREKIEEMTHTTNPFFGPLEELEAIKFEEINYESLNTLTKVQDHQEFLLKLLTKKDSFVRKALLNKGITYLNTRLQFYLTALGLPHIVEFTHEMTARITHFGRSLDFGNLSAGQRARVNIALSFAFRDVLQSLHHKINVCMLDEILDVGLDSIGVQAAARLVKRKARDEDTAMYIISHRDEIDRAFDKIMTVQLQNGFSYIVEN